MTSPSKYYPFIEMEKKDLDMEKMMAEMKKMGMGGMSMYDRDDMEEMAAAGDIDGEYGMDAPMDEL